MSSSKYDNYPFNPSAAFAIHKLMNARKLVFATDDEKKKLMMLFTLLFWSIDINDQCLARERINYINDIKQLISLDNYDFICNWFAHAMKSIGEIDNYRIDLL